MIQAHALAFTDIACVELQPITMDEPGPDEVLVRIEATAISPGTELRCLAGLQPDSEPFPFIPGYSAAGLVEWAPEGSPLLGRRVFCTGTRHASIARQWGGHVSRAVLKASDVFVAPSSVPSRDLALAKMVSIALHGVRLADPQPGDKVAVIGLGPIGLLCARLYARAGAEVLGVDRAVERLARSGISTVHAPNSSAEAVRSIFKGGADIVVDATGVAAAIEDSIQAARDLPWGQSNLHGPKLIVQGSYPGAFAIPYQEAFRKELSVWLPRDSRPIDVQDAVGLIAGGEIELSDLISWFGDPSRAPEAYSLLKGDRSALAAGFDWSGY